MYQAVGVGKDADRYTRKAVGVGRDVDMCTRQCGCGGMLIGVPGSVGVGGDADRCTRKAVWVWEGMLIGAPGRQCGCGEGC